MRYAATLSFIALLTAAPMVGADLKVEITEGVEGGVPIVVLPFDDEPADLPRGYSRIIASDLAYSGLFSLLPAGDFEGLARPGTDGGRGYRAWAELGAEKIVAGKIAPNGELQIELFNVVQQEKLRAWAFPLQGYRPSGVAHYASDLIYEELTGVPGIFRTRLAFVSSKRLDARTRSFSLHIADADGHNDIRIFTAPNTLMSPTWSPDHQRIAYVSYENGRPEIFVQVLRSGERTNLSKAIGSANSPDWSSDGDRLAYVSSHSGNPEIYVYNFSIGGVARITRNLAIDTEPAWSPDGAIVFTSDRSGSPQLYRVNLADSEIKRLTFEGQYNSDADISPNGDKMAYVSLRPTGFSIFVHDLARDNKLELSFGSLDERPRFAPNGQLLSYLTEQPGHPALGLLTTDGLFGKLVAVDAQNVRGIAWSPLPPKR